MSLLGPQGFAEVGELILARSGQAARRLAAIEGVSVTWTDGYFREFVVNFDGTGKTVADINAVLRGKGIFGGLDLSATFPALGQSALYCVTEVHRAEDIARLGDAIEEAIR